MAAPPPRPPPPTSPLKHTTTPTETAKTQSPRPFSAEFGCSRESHNQLVTPKERGRSNTFTGPSHIRSPLPEPRTPPPVLPRPAPPSRSSSSPPPLPTLTEGEGGGGRGRGREKTTGSSGRVPPSRPPPPSARARSLPRGGSLRTWEQGNGGKIGKTHSKSSDNVLKTGRLTSPLHASGPGSVLNGDLNRSTPADGITDDVIVGGAQETGDVASDTPTSGERGTTETTDPPSSPPHTVTKLPETTPPQSDQPVIPPRPYRPPRPFPPPPGDTKGRTSSAGSQAHSGVSRPKKRMHKTHHGDPRHRPPESQGTEPLSTTTTTTTTNSTGPSEGEGSHDSSSDHMTSHDPTTTTDNVPSSQSEGSQAMAQGASGAGSVASDGDEGQKQVSTEKDDTITKLSSSEASPKQSRTGRKKLFHSVRKGISKIRHKSARSSSMPSTFRPQRRCTSDDIGGGGALGEVAEEEEEMYPDPLPQGIVNPLVILCVAYLNRETVLKEPGLFRIPGDVSSVKKLRSNYIRGEPVNLMEELDPHTIAGLLKYQFREWRVSIIPRGKPLEEVTAAVRERDEERVRQVLQGLPRDSLATLRVVTELLSKVVEYGEWNKMTSGTLAMSCGQSFFPYLPTSPANSLLKFMVDHCTTLFPE